ncbi:vacuolar iron transporter homolog 3-like [Neltuma alba]|uniref:vacuolar iron transporter homolog 3-like n=1 Tax=Neltuma alba TaxID=207710 RepID=UPI0010A3EAA2|nr:vacuolar iron transporter homolog 3-like [Prosopis alba]
MVMRLVEVDNLQGAILFRTAVFKANEGLVWTVSLYVELMKEDVGTRIIVVCVGSVCGALAMAICEFVSASSKFEIKEARLKRGEELTDDETNLPCPLMAAMAAAGGFACSAIFPIVAAPIREYKVRLAAAVGVASVASPALGMLIARLGKAPVVNSSLSFLIGGWLLMASAFAFIKFLDEIRCEKEPICGYK